MQILKENCCPIRSQHEKKSWAGWACTKTGRERSCYEFSCAFRARVQGPLHRLIHFTGSVETNAGLNLVKCKQR